MGRGRKKGDLGLARQDATPIKELLASADFNEDIPISKTFPGYRISSEELDELERIEHIKIPRDKDGFQLQGSYASRGRK